MNGRSTPKSMILSFIKRNGPCTVKDLAEGISEEYKQDLTSKEISNYVRMMNGHHELEVKGRAGAVSIWGIPTVDTVATADMETGMRGGCPEC